MRDSVHTRYPQLWLIQDLLSKNSTSTELASPSRTRYHTLSSDRLKTLTLCLFTPGTSHITFGSAEGGGNPPLKWWVEFCSHCSPPFSPLPQSLNGPLASFPPPQVPRPKLSLSSWKMSSTFRMGSFADTIGFEASPAVTSIGCKMRKNYGSKN